VGLLLAIGRQQSFGPGAVAGNLSCGAFFFAEGFEAFDVVFGEHRVDTFFDVCEFASLCESDEGDSASVLIGGESTGSPDTVNVIIAVFGDVVIDDVGDAADVNTASNNICGDEESEVTGAEFFDDAITFALREVSVDTGDAPGFKSFGEDLVEFISPAFGACEDDDLAGFFAGKDADKEREFAIFVDGDVELFDGIDDDPVFGEVDGFGLDHVFLRQPHDFRGHGGGQEQCLAVSGAGAENAFDVWAEADIEHPVGFVENGDVEVIEVEVSAAHQILDATRSTDNDLGTITEVIDLFAHWATANGKREADGAVGCKFSRFCTDLFAEFAGGCEHQYLNFGEVKVDLFQSREHKGSRFAGAGACLTDAVFAVKCNGDQGSLNGAW
jgi:hypothetical protein